MNYEVGYKEYCCISCGFSWKDMLDSQVGECPRCGSKDTFCSENTDSRVGLDEYRTFRGCNFKLGLDDD